MLRRALLLIAWSAGLLAACTRGSSDSTSAQTTSLAASASARPSGRPSDPSKDRAVIDFVAKADDCTFGHRGVLLDLGDASMRARMSGAQLAKPDVEVREHEGASWVSIRGRSLDLSFVAAQESKPEGGIIIEARAKGGLAKSASVYLNQKPIGTLSFTKNETAVVSTHAQGMIQRGQNELLLRFNGGSKQQHDALAEIDWIRVGPVDDGGPYAAPTRNDALTSVTINGAAHRSVSLRAPGFDRCTAFVPSGSILEGLIGVSGGEAEAEVRVLVDRQEPRVVGSFHLGGPTDPVGWRPMALPLGDVGTIAAIELVAKSSTKGARVAFADARVVAPGAPVAAVEIPKAKGVIVVALGSTSRRLIGLNGGTIALPELEALANGGTVFEAHRATSSFATGAVGSMLTGLTPRDHGASDPDAALSPTVFTVAEAARQAGIMTAMFTANPTTSQAFGFGRGWETFDAKMPADDVAATSVFDDATKWLDQHKDERFLLVVHARGGHPPWDVTPEELKDMPPTGYQGGLDPKHAGEVLAKSRKVGSGRLADADRERAFALHAKALAAHDAALGALVAHVKQMGRDKDTVWIVTGDVGLDAAARVPFLEEESLDEGALAIPLVVRTPGAPARARVETATSSVDIAPTILDALSLAPPTQLAGASLFGIAANAQALGERVLVASEGTRFSARWGTFAIVGARERETKVCNLSLDAECVSDVRASHPIAAEALHALAWTQILKVDAPPTDALAPRANADGPTSVALHAWGR
jgi:arylsulfatase A-like enzyme